MEPTTDRLATGSRFEDRFEILGELGSGSFGRVYRARQLSTGQSVAIKILSPREGTDESTGREAERSAAKPGSAPSSRIPTSSA